MGTTSSAGKGSSGSQGGYNVTSGGAGLPFNFGPSPFDLSAIGAATGDNTAAVTNRYNQLGLGGSTMENQDLTGQDTMGQAAIGQEQTQTVADPAINTSLQPSVNSLIGVGSTQAANQGLTSALSSLANQANANSQFSSGAGSILSGANLDSTFSNLDANAFG
jgi:hypothetical protein